MKKSILWLMVVLMIALSGCGGSEELNLKDGSYKKTSGKDPQGGYVEVEIVVKDGKIESCEMELYDRDGKVKDENYGKGTSEGIYKVAQDAVKLARTYPNTLVEVQDIEAVDAISGATESYQSFQEAVREIFKEAKAE